MCCVLVIFKCKVITCYYEDNYQLYKSIFLVSLLISTKAAILITISAQTKRTYCYNLIHLSSLSLQIRYSR
jgi:hypothetical protein